MSIAQRMAVNPVAFNSRTASVHTSSNNVRGRVIIPGTGVSTSPDHFCMSSITFEEIVESAVEHGETVVIIGNFRLEAYSRAGKIVLMTTNRDHQRGVVDAEWFQHVLAEAVRFARLQHA